MQTMSHGSRLKEATNSLAHVEQMVNVLLQPGVTLRTKRKGKHAVFEKGKAQEGILCIDRRQLAISMSKRSLCQANISAADRCESHLELLVHRTQEEAYL